MLPSDKNSSGDLEKSEMSTFAAAADNSSTYDRLLTEYKTIQDKIDKAADFRYRVRSWSVTITAGLLAASTAAKIPWWYSIFGLAPVILFAINEHNQKCIGNALGSRAIEIEEALEALDSKCGKGSPLLLGSAPQFGRQLRAIAKEGRQLPFRMRKLHSAKRVQKVKASVGWVRRIKDWSDYKWNWLGWRSDNLFYWGQAIVILVVAGISGYKDGFALAAPEKVQYSIVTNYVFGVNSSPINVPVSISNSFSPTFTVTNSISSSNFVIVSNFVFVTNQQVIPHPSLRSITNEYIK